MGGGAGVKDGEKEGAARRMYSTLPPKIDGDTEKNNTSSRALSGDIQTEAFDTTDKYPLRPPACKTHTNNTHTHTHTPLPP